MTTKKLEEKTAQVIDELNSLVEHPKTEAGLRYVARGLLVLIELNERNRQNNLEAFEQIVELGKRQVPESADSPEPSE